MEQRQGSAYTIKKMYKHSCFGKIHKGHTNNFFSFILKAGIIALVHSSLFTVLVSNKKTWLEASRGVSVFRYFFFHVQNKTRNIVKKITPQEYSSDIQTLMAIVGITGSSFVTGLLFIVAFALPNPFFILTGLIIILSVFFNTAVYARELAEYLKKSTIIKFIKKIQQDAIKIADYS